MKEGKCPFCGEEIPGIRVTQNCGSGSMKSGMKRADRSGAALAVIVGEDELATGTLTVKPLRDGGEQRQLAQREAMRWLAGWMNDNRENDSGG